FLVQEFSCTGRYEPAATVRSVQRIQYSELRHAGRRAVDNQFERHTNRGQRGKNNFSCARNYAAADAVRIEVRFLRCNMDRREFIAAAALSMRAARLPDATSVIVEAGRFDRRSVVVSFPLPSGLSAKSYVLRDDSGRTSPLQIDRDQASFVLV